MLGFLLVLAAALPPEEEYAARAAAVKVGDAKTWLGLADFCEQKGLFERRTEALRKALEADPEQPAAHARLDEKKTGGRWLPADEADAAEEALQAKDGKAYYGKSWVPQAEAGKAAAADSKAAGFHVSVRIDTPHFSLYSGHGYGLTRRFADVLESGADAYCAFYGSVWKTSVKPKPIKVLFFPDRDSFCRTVAPIMGDPPPSAQGVYSSKMKILYVSAPGNLSPEFTQICALHESIHGLDDAMVPGASSMAPWLAEGRADHLGFAILGRQVIPGVLRLSPESARVSQFRLTGDIRLQALLKMTQADFESERMTQYYCLSWALVSYLLHGEDGRYAPTFRKLLSGGKMPGAEGLAKALGTELPAFEAAFKAYVEKEFLPAVESGRPPGP